MTDRRRFGLGLGAAIALSAAAVWTAFNPVPHSGGDNAGYLSLAYGLLTEGAYLEVFDPLRAPHTKYPPVFPTLLALMMALGARTWVAFKATAAVSTVGSVALAYLWAERRLGVLAGFAVAALLALSSGVVYYSHWILSDPVFAVLTLGALVALDRAEEGPRARLWLATGIVATGLALFTRTAGLPLVVAVLGWLTLERRWRALGVAAVALGVPALLWWVRARNGEVATYGEEFWMVDPYRPELGTVGLFGLVPRLLGNLSAYVTTHGPGGIVGRTTPGLPLFGLVLGVAGVAGWVWRVRERIGPAELFFPLYAGLILLWPEVWAGDRFALPLYPLFFVYGAIAIRWLGTRIPRPGEALVAGVAVVALILPATGSWSDAASQSRACASAARAGGGFACYGPGVASFVDAARWAGGALPDGAAVLSRKPRHFYVMSGVPSRTFPFSVEVEDHLALADRTGARYVLLDQWDGQAGRYLAAAIRERPTAFCYIASIGDPSRGGAQLFGIRPEGEAVGTDGDEPSVERCPPDYLGPGASEAYEPSASSWSRVPLLDRLDS